MAVAVDSFESAIRAESAEALRAATARAERYEKALRAVTVGGIDSRRPLTTDGYENIINGLRYVARAALSATEEGQGHNGLMWATACPVCGEEAKAIPRHKVWCSQADKGQG